MDDRTKKLIARSISDNHLHWQATLLENQFSTVKFRKFKTAFLEATLDYTSLYKELSAIELELETNKYLL